MSKNQSIHHYEKRLSTGLMSSFERPRPLKTQQTPLRPAACWRSDTSCQQVALLPSSIMSFHLLRLAEITLVMEFFGRTAASLPVPQQQFVHTLKTWIHSPCQTISSD